MSLSVNSGKKEWIFFDLDGTLANSISPLFNVYRNFLKELEIPSDDGDLSHLNGLSLLEIISFLKGKYKIGQSEKALHDLYKLKVGEAYEKEVTPMDGADKSIQVLSKSFKFQLVTSGDSQEAMGFIRRQGWENMFTGFVFGSEVQKGKPNPEIYQLAIKRSGSPVSSIVTVEDSINGVKASTQAGLATIGFADRTKSKDLLDAGAYAVITRLDELITHLAPEK
jgi:HAD superfamily hydrolase (TIGR01509 family)